MKMWTSPMGRVFPVLVGASLSLGLPGCGQSSPSQDTVTLLAPAAPGGGWDQTARAMQQVFRSTGLAPTAQVLNVPGAGGVVGLARGRHLL